MPWTMIAASIGAQLFNSWQANKKTEELQARQREFQKAAQRREFDRMRQLQREAAQLALEIEADVHKQRLEDIEANYDDVVKQYSTEIAIKKWPLKVLPFVMRGESFGTFFNGSKSIALHTILTPSNCDRFNEAAYMDIDLQLEAACNEHWNAQTSHPIAYYGGAWRKPTLDLDHIDLLKTQLKNVPTVVITPYFGPQLYFKVKMWGMGKDTEVKIELPKNLFSYEYEKGMNYSPKDETPKGDLIDTTIEEFVSYLECLVGFISDKYFWSMYKVLPLLPHLIACNKISINNTIKGSVTFNYKTEIEQTINNLKCASLTYDEFDSYLTCIAPIVSENQLKQYKSDVKIYSEIMHENELHRKDLEFTEVLSDKCDILEYIAKYEEYIDRNSIYLSFEPTLVIANTEFRTLYIYTIDERINSYVDLSETFAFKVKFQQMTRDKNARLLFSRYAKNGILKINKHNINTVKSILTKLTY